MGSDPERRPLRGGDQLRLRLRRRLEVLLHDAHRRDDAVADHRLLNNRYYWRVRGIDADGNFGVWNYWSNPTTHEAFFRKTFDTRDPGDFNPAIQRLRMVDNQSDPDGDGTDFDPGTDGYRRRFRS